MADDARANIDAAITNLLERLASEIEADAKAACPVKTGRLAASTSSVRYQVPSLSLPFSRCTLDKTV